MGNEYITVGPFKKANRLNVHHWNWCPPLNENLLPTPLEADHRDNPICILKISWQIYVHPKIYTFIHIDIDIANTSALCPSVRLRVTHLHCIKTAKFVVEIISSPVSAPSSKWWKKQSFLHFLCARVNTSLLSTIFVAKTSLNVKTRFD